MTRKFWKDLWFLLLFALIGLILTAGVMVLLQLWLGTTVLMLHLAQWGQNLLLMLLPPIVWTIYYKKEHVQEVMYLRWPGMRVMSVTVLLMLVSLPLLESLAEICQQIPLPQWLEQFAQSAIAEQEAVLQVMLGIDGFWGWTSLIMLMCIMTAIGEEVMFRGALMRCFVSPDEDSRTRLWTTAICVGLLFSLIHGEVYGFIPRALLGALFVVLVRCTGSIWPAVLAHAINNLFALIEMKISPRWLMELGGDLWQVVLSAVLAVMVLRLLIRVGLRK